MSLLARVNCGSVSAKISLLCKIKLFSELSVLETSICCPFYQQVVVPRLNVFRLKIKIHLIHTECQSTALSRQRLFCFWKNRVDRKIDHSYSQVSQLALSGEKSNSKSWGRYDKCVVSEIKDKVTKTKRKTCSDDSFCSYPDVHPLPTRKKDFYMCAKIWKIDKILAKLCSFLLFHVKFISLIQDFHLDLNIC